jgi:hypothetical protein
MTEREHPSGPTIGWGWLTTGLAVFSAACLATLIVVVAVKNIDILSTVALALAVLAFSAQLIVTMAQSQQFGQLNADTKSALTEMRATTSSLLTNQREQFDRVLKYALRQAVPAAVEDVASAEDEQPSTDRGERAAELETALETRLDEVLKQLRTSSSLQPDVNQRLSLTNVDSPNRARRLREWRALMAEYPSRPEGEPVVEILRQLPTQAISMLARIADDAGKSSSIKRTVPYRTSPTNPSMPGIDRLLETGLVEAVAVDEAPDGQRISRYRLTPTGIIAARLLQGQGQLPDWAADLA